MPIITIDAWADGPDPLGLWRGHWHLLRDGIVIKGRFGVTGDRFLTQDEAIDAAIRRGLLDKRNVPEGDMKSWH